MEFTFYKSSIFRCIKIFLSSMGIIFSGALLLSFTSLPFWMYYGLSAPETNMEITPDYIIVLGGGGIPSESGLMRCYKAQQEACAYPWAKIIIALPGDTIDTNSSVQLMKEELQTRGINPQRILLEAEGLNTRMQALNIASQISTQSSILLISSPEHMFRAKKTFRKAGFEHVYGNPAFERAIESSLTFGDEKLGGNEFIYNVGDNLQIRYQFWNHLKYQIIVYREYAAIIYYKLKGWM